MCGDDYTGDVLFRDFCSLSYNWASCFPNSSLGQMVVG